MEDSAAGDQVLQIQTGHKLFQIKSADAAELKLWHLRLQEVIMLQEQVAPTRALTLALPLPS